MPCLDLTSKKMYQNLATSIYTPKCNISSTQHNFLVNLPAYHQLDLSTRKSNGNKKCPNRCKGERRNKKSLSHSDIINLNKSRAYYDPRSFRKSY